jgi:hypothetical protein
MTISHGGYAFESIGTHGMPMEHNWVNEPKVSRFCGVVGAVEIRDAIHEREIRLWAKFSGYSTRALLQTALNTLDSKINTLNDATLTITVSGDVMTYYHCTFRGFERDSTGFYSVAGGTIWQQDGWLVWTQLKRTS